MTCKAALVVVALLTVMTCKCEGQTIGQFFVINVQWCNGTVINSANSGSVTPQGCNSYTGANGNTYQKCLAYWKPGGASSGCYPGLRLAPSGSQTAISASISTANIKGQKSPVSDASTTAIAVDFTNQIYAWASSSRTLGIEFVAA